MHSRIKPQTKQHSSRLTNCGLTKLLIGNLIGNVGPHQHAHGDAKLLLDHVRNELQSVRSLVHTLVKQKENTGGVYIKQHQAGIWVKDWTAGLELL